MEEFTFNIINAFILSVMGLLSDRMTRNRKKEILRNRLMKDGWNWRTFDSLRRSIRDDEATTRELLFEIGARASTKNKDSWTLES